MSGGMANFDAVYSSASESFGAIICTSRRRYNDAMKQLPKGEYLSFHHVILRQRAIEWDGEVNWMAELMLSVDSFAYPFRVGPPLRELGTIILVFVLTYSRLIFQKFRSINTQAASRYTLLRLDK